MQIKVITPLICTRCLHLKITSAKACADPQPPAGWQATRSGRPGTLLGPSGRRSWLEILAFAPVLQTGYSGVIRLVAAPLLRIPRIASRVGTHKPGTRGTLDSVQLALLGAVALSAGRRHRLARSPSALAELFVGAHALHLGAGALPPRRDRRPGGRLPLGDAALRLPVFRLWLPPTFGNPAGAGCACRGGTETAALRSLRLAPPIQLAGLVVPKGLACVEPKFALRFRRNHATPRSN